MQEGGSVSASPDHNILLKVDNLGKRFGGIHALADVAFELEKGSINSLIGPNGAGKTTFINVVTGIHAADSGEIVFQAENISGLPAHVIASKGIGRTFQLEELFAGLSVMENTLVGCHTQSSSGMLACGFSLPRARKEEKRLREIAMESLTFVGLEKRANDPISKLPLGERKLVGVARALSMNPTLLMLDEPVGGLAAHEAKKLVDLIYMLVGKGLTIFIVEHDLPFVMSLPEEVIVLDEGTKIAEGPPEQVRANQEVIRAYLGDEV